MRVNIIDQGLIMVPFEQCHHTPLFAGFDGVKLSRLAPLLIKRPFTEDNSAPLNAAIRGGRILVDMGKKLWMGLMAVLQVACCDR